MVDNWLKNSVSKYFNTVKNRYNGIYIALSVVTQSNENISIFTKRKPYLCNSAREMNNIIKAEINNYPSIKRITIVFLDDKLNLIRSPFVYENNIQEKTEGFGGLSGAEIESHVNGIIEKRWREKEQENELQLKTKEVEDLKKQVHQLNEALEQLSGEKSNLETLVEKKNDLKYYLGLVGTFLDGLGIPLERVNNKFVNMLGGFLEDEDETKNQLQANNESNIASISNAISSPSVPDPVDDKKSAIIEVLNEFFNHVENNILHHVFIICSEIEQRKELAPILSQFSENIHVLPTQTIEAINAQVQDIAAKYHNRSKTTTTTHEENNNESNNENKGD